MAENDPNNQGLQNNSQQVPAGGMKPSMPMEQYNNRQQQQRGTGFTNISRILGANQGAGEKIGQKIGSGINDQANAVRQGIQQGQSSFQAGKNESFGQASGAIDVGKQMARQAGEADDAYSNRVAQSQGDLASQGQALQNAAYTGPQGLSNEGLLQTKASTAGALARLGGSSAGQNQLLHNLVANRGQYTQGQAGLDQLLLGQGGQKYVQAARQGAAGLEQQASGAITSAQQQAQNAKSAIDTNKVNALQSVRNSLSGAGDESSNNVTGLQTIAQKQAQDFNKNAGRLSQILQGVDENGQPLTNLSDSDKALLEQAQDYGLDTSASLYEKDPNAVQNAINNLARTSINQGALKYSGNQQQAAGNLAAFLGDKQLQDQIKNNKFDSDAFKTSEQDAFGQLGSQKAYDQETQQILNEAAKQVGGAEQSTLKANEQKFNNYKDLINKNTDLSPERKSALLSGITNEYNRSNTSLTNNDNFNQANAQAQMADRIASFGGQDIQNYSQDMQRILGVGGQNQFGEVNKPFDSDVTMNDAINSTNVGGHRLDQNKFILDRAFGDADIDQRFKGLGLGVQDPNGANKYRSSGQLTNAANKVLSPEESLKQYLLKKYGNS